MIYLYYVPEKNGIVEITVDSSYHYEDIDFLGITAEGNGGKYSGWIFMEHCMMTDLKNELDGSCVYIGEYKR